MNPKDKYFNIQSNSAGSSGTSGFVDDYAVKIEVQDFNNPVLENVNYQFFYLQEDLNTTQIEAVNLSFPSGVYGDNTTTPTDNRTFKMSVWLSESSGPGVTNPANANSEANGVSAVVATAPAGSTNEQLTSNLGSNIGQVNFTSAVYRGWFRLQTTLSTSTASVIARSSNGSFADIVMRSESSLNGDSNFLNGSFTFNLFAAGINTLTKIQSLQIYHRTVDAVAGVNQATTTVDAGALEIDIIL